MQRDDPTGHGPGGPAPVGPGADTVLAALAHRLRARSERQQLLTERLRSGELRPGALADLAELAAAARRGVRDGDHILVMAGAEVPDRGSGGGPVPLGQALSAAVAASEAASRTVVPPTPSLSLEPSVAPVFAQIMAELLAHATAATAPGERLEAHTRWGPDGGLVLELLSPRPVPTRTPLDDLDRMLSAGRPDGPVAPQEIGLYLAARLARAIGGRLGVRGSPGVASAPGPSPVAVLQLPPSVLAGGSRPGEDALSSSDEPAVTDESDVFGDSGSAGDEPTGLVPSAPSPSSPPGTSPGDPLSGPSDPEPSAPPWPPVPAADAGTNGAHPHTPIPNDPFSTEGAPNGSGPPGAVPNGPLSQIPYGSPAEQRETPSGPGVARLPVPPPPQEPQAPLAPPSSSPQEGSPLPPPGPPGPTGAGLHIPPGPRGPGGPGRPGQFSGPDQPGPQLSGPNQPGQNRHGPGQPGPQQPGSPQRGPNLPGPNQPGPVPPGAGPSGPNGVGPNRPGPGPIGPGGAGQNGTGPDRAGPGRDPLAPGPFPPEEPDAPPVTEALPVSGTTPPVELFGPFDSEVPVPVDDLDGTPIFAAVASAWFRDPNTTPNGAPAAPGTNGRRPSGEPTNWTTAGDAEFEAARSRAERVVEPPVTANGLPMRRPGQQMVPPARRNSPPPAPQAPAASERQPDRVRNRLASYQRGLREGRHRAAEENTGDLNGAAPHGRNGHAAG
ncbi:hypothetical protein [Pseudonocardia endophytica]|uniref:Uncharacterized protein n=1 Tax=Pseudonocardia endophytica TaxID=401976 RepID=A0A4R1HPA4_PSEEN|nr:hypothetical protein [Pseudonocardia endophytica]TCK22485.1 hypothetical protein EV378_6489 [Pseudonocardia endophytica]